MYPFYLGYFIFTKKVPQPIIIIKSNFALITISSILYKNCENPKNLPQASSLDANVDLNFSSHGILLATVNANLKILYKFLTFLAEHSQGRIKQILIYNCQNKGMCCL